MIQIIQYLTYTIQYDGVMMQGLLKCQEEKLKNEFKYIGCYIPAEDMSLVSRYRTYDTKDILNNIVDLNYYGELLITGNITSDSPMVIQGIHSPEYMGTYINLTSPVKKSNISYKLPWVPFNYAIIRIMPHMKPKFVLI